MHYFSLRRQITFEQSSFLCVHFRLNPSTHLKSIIPLDKRPNETKYCYKNVYNYCLDLLDLAKLKLLTFTMFRLNFKILIFALLATVFKTLL